MRKKRNDPYWAKVLHPVALLLYGTICFYLYSLLQYGGVKRKAPIILGGTIILMIWVLWCYVKYRRPKAKVSIQEDSTITREEHTPNKVLRSRWITIAPFILLFTTLVTGVKIYQSGINFNGKLSWFIHDLKNKRQVEFTNSNIYQDHLDGILKDIQSRVDMPEDLYVSADFGLRFNKEGRIVSFDTFLYGRNEEGETESFLISYNEDKSEKITVYLNGYVHGDYDENKRLQPLMDMIQWIPLQETVSPWDQEPFGILYSGVRSWGYNSEGIIYIHGEGNTRQQVSPMDEIIGYTVSVYIPGKEDMITPVRFINGEIKDSAKGTGSEAEEYHWETGYIYNDGEETFFLDNRQGYQLSIADAALGSRFYVLLETQDGGATWEILNQDPFSGRTGVSSGIIFINEELGFIGLSHSGGSYGELYRTEDGGSSYEEAKIPPIEVPLTDREKYNPFDLPGMPYEEDGKLFLKVGQGQDGDYKGGIKALYRSKDKGETWEYIKEVE